MLLTVASLLRLPVPRNAMMSGLHVRQLCSKNVFSLNFVITLVLRKREVEKCNGNLETGFVIGDLTLQDFLLMHAFIYCSVVAKEC